MEAIEEYTGNEIERYEISKGEYHQILFGSEDGSNDWQKLMNEANKEDTINIDIATNHKVIPAPEPGIAWGKALKGGYIVHPADAAPPSTTNEIIIITDETKKNQ